MSETKNHNIQSTSGAYQQMEQQLGVAGMQMLDEQLETWNNLNERELESPLRESLLSGDTTLPEGTLLHSTGMHAAFDDNVLQGIAENGILSGELTGKSEDSETHGCADFFRVAKALTIKEYMDYAIEPVVEANLHTSRSERLLRRGITFIVDPNAEGMAEVLARDGYRDADMNPFIKTPAGRSAEDTAAILGGVPRGALAGIICSSGRLQQPNVAETLETTFPGLPIFNFSGEPSLHTEVGLDI